MSCYAYARVSSKDQNLERQLAAFADCGVAIDKIYCDKQSGKDFERTSYKKLLRKIRAGDLLIIKSIDRLGRNYDAVIEEWGRITKIIHADIFVLDIPLGKFISDIVLQLLSFVAENERENIRHRQAEGIKLALEKGVKFGRPRIQLPPDFKSIADLYLSKQIGYAEALSLTAMRPTTFYRYVKEFTKNHRAI